MAAMKLHSDLQRAVAAAVAAAGDGTSARRAVGLLDLTSLGDADGEAEAVALCRRAVTSAGPVAAVCVWPCMVAAARRELAGAPVKVCTVVNFPGGGTDAAAVVDETAKALAAGADEIDMVMPYRAFIDGARTQPLSVLRACREACGPGVVLKVILETGAFPTPDLLTWAARDAIAAGADFLKTSTGKTRPAATPEAAALLLHVIGQSSRAVGLKISGGLASVADAATYLALADQLMGEEWATAGTFRLGASALLEPLLAALRQ
jgi:deoxyribose-phosphate aldolase